jgi:hypothetical protein
MSEQVLKELVVAVLAMKGDSGLLSALKQALPVQSASADLVFQGEVDHRLRKNHEAWKRGDKSEAVGHVLDLHRGLHEEEFHLRGATLDALLAKIRNYLRLYLEETLAAGDEAEILPLVKREGLAIADLHADYSVLVLFWETLFFSSKFSTQQLSEEFFQEHPKVTRHIDVDRVLARANRQKDEGRFRKLVEISLQYDLEDYEKTRAFEGLLVYQCERGLFQGATTTLQSAKNLNVSVGADAMTIYTDLQRDLKNPKEYGIFSQITGIFSRKDKS